MLSILLWALGLFIAIPLVIGGRQGYKEARARHAKEGARAERMAEINRDVNDYVDKLKALALPAVPVKITDETSDQLLESRLGGRPAWPKDKRYPAAKGKFPLAFLAQINLGDMPALEKFPSHGLLQFYFAADDLYGMDFDAGQHDIVVVYHEDLTAMREWDMFPKGKAKSPYATHADDLDAPFQYENWWETGYKLGFGEVVLMYPTEDDYRVAAQAYRVFDYFLDDKTRAEYRADWYAGQPKHFVVGGHPFFTQADPREYDESLRVYTRTLLALGSSDKILWGDSGTGAFLIKEADLARRDFSDIHYNYDCY